MLFDLVFAGLKLEIVKGIFDRSQLFLGQRRRGFLSDRSCSCITAAIFIGDYELICAGRYSSVVGHSDPIVSRITDIRIEYSEVICTAREYTVSPIATEVWPWISRDGRHS